MIKRFLDLLRDFKPSQSPVLGRWCRVGKHKNDWKIDMANNDHCGTCSYTHPKKTSTTKSTDLKIKKDTLQ